MRLDLRKSSNAEVEPRIRPRSQIDYEGIFILMIKLAEVGIVRYLQIGVEPRLKRPLELVE